MRSPSPEGGVSIIWNMQIGSQASLPTKGAGLQSQSDSAEQVYVSVVDRELHKYGSGQTVQPGVVKEILEGSVERGAFRDVSIHRGSLPSQPREEPSASCQDSSLCFCSVPQAPGPSGCCWECRGSKNVVPSLLASHHLETC